MNPQEPIQAEDDEISLIDILLFLQASFSNVVKSLVGCLFAGGIYYFSIPKMYEATATIEMARVAGEPVETPAVLLEKMKLPLYFSPATIQACGSDGGLSSQAKFVDKIKPSINKSAPMVSFVTQAPSTQEAKACLSVIIDEVSSKQDEIANKLIVNKKQKLNQLLEQLKLTEIIEKSLSSPGINNNPTDPQSTAGLLVIFLKKTNVAEINRIRSEISSLELELIEPRTRPTFVLNSVFSSEFSVNKRPLFTLGLCLALGVFLGFLVTGVMRMAPGIRQKMRDAAVCPANFSG
jgi:hypothetical protein